MYSFEMSNESAKFKANTRKLFTFPIECTVWISTRGPHKASFRVIKKNNLANEFNSFKSILLFKFSPKWQTGINVYVFLVCKS